MILKKNLMINNNPQIKIKKNSLSFRDPASRIYEIVNENGKLIKILRGLRKDSLNNFKELSENLFFKKFLKSEMVVKSELKILDDQNTKKIKEDGWKGVIEHEVLDFISYPYEWSFSMLKDSALLHLFIIKKSYENSWTLKDSSAYNVQWKNGKPIFIDLASFVPCNGDFKWIGYRQFCSMFLIPLLIKKYLDININNILRSNLDGVSLELGSKYFQSFNKFRKGVFSHIFIPNVLNLFINPDKKIYEGSEYHGIQISCPAVYSVSKHAVIGLTKYLASYWGEYNIRVNAISAGPMRTLAGAAIANSRDVFNFTQLNSPLKRNVELDEIGNTALFFVSNLSNAITGDLDTKGVRLSIGKSF